MAGGMLQLVRATACECLLLRDVTKAHTARFRARPLLPPLLLLLLLFLCPVPVGRGGGMQLLRSATIVSRAHCCSERPEPLPPPQHPAAGSFQFPCHEGAQRGTDYSSSSSPYGIDTCTPGTVE